MITRSKVGIYKPNLKYFVGHTSLKSRPTSVAEVFQIPHWKQAMQQEFDALYANHMWKLIPWQPDYNIVGTK